MSDRDIYIEGEVFNGKVKTRLERQYTKGNVWLKPVTNSLTDIEKQSLILIAERAGINETDLFLSASEVAIHTEKAAFKSSNQTFNEENNQRKKTQSINKTIEKLCDLLTDDTTHSPSIVNQLMFIASQNLDCIDGPAPDLKTVIDNLSILRTAHQLAIADMTSSMESRHTTENFIREIAGIYSQNGGEVGQGSVTNIFNDYVIICLAAAGHEKVHEETIRKRIAKYIN